VLVISLKKYLVLYITYIELQKGGLVKCLNTQSDEKGAPCQKPLRKDQTKYYGGYGRQFHASPKLKFVLLRPCKYLPKPQWIDTVPCIFLCPTQSFLKSIKQDSAFCKIHCSEAGENKIGWAEKENGTLLPNVNASLAVLGPNVKNLIQVQIE